MSIIQKKDTLKNINYRPIKLLNISFKIFAVLLNKRFDIVEKNLMNVKWDFIHTGLLLTIYS